MNIITKIQDVRHQVKTWKQAGFSVGFVPTMGYLHEGHASLIEKAHAENDKVIVSDFVNPMQFGPTEDLASYPRNIERDSKIAQAAGADCIFHPEADEIYFPDFSSFVDMEGLTEELCGKSRPVHFRGVCTVVSKLFNIVVPDRAYFGEKDAQQLAVIRHMVQDLNFDVEVVGCPIIREDDGLAKSSRNSYLSTEERQAAIVLNTSLNQIRSDIEDGERNVATLIATLSDLITTQPLANIDYLEIVDSKSLKPVIKINDNILVAIAVYIGKTRLIDNFSYTFEGK